MNDQCSNFDKEYRIFLFCFSLGLLFISHIIPEYCYFKLNLLISTGVLKYCTKCANDSFLLLYHNTAFVTYVRVSQKIRLCCI